MDFYIIIQLVYLQSESNMSVQYPLSPPPDCYQCYQLLNNIANTSEMGSSLANEIGNSVPFKTTFILLIKIFLLSIMLKLRLSSIVRNTKRHCILNMICCETKRS